eukprot:scaffold32374_cov73-Cyclotella_meneghiniana.AAC.4
MTRSSRCIRRRGGRPLTRPRSHRMTFRQRRIKLARRFMQRLGIPTQIGMRTQIFRSQSRNNRAGTGGTRSSHEHHDSGSATGQCQIQEGGGDAHGAACATCRSFVGGYRPWILA